MQVCPFSLLSRRVQHKFFMALRTTGIKRTEKRSKEKAKGRNLTRVLVWRACGAWKRAASFAEFSTHPCHFRLSQSAATIVPGSGSPQVLRQPPDGSYSLPSMKWPCIFVFYISFYFSADTEI